MAGPGLAPKPLRPQAIYRGATWRGKLPITLEDKVTPKDLTGSTIIRWALYDINSTLALPLYNIGTGIVFQGPPTNGIIVVHLDEDTTALLEPGQYRQEWYIEDGVDDVQVYRGRLDVADANLWETV